MEKAFELLEKLANKLGVTVEHLWNAVVSQAKIDAIISSIVSIIFLSVLVFDLTYFRKKFIDSLKEDKYSDSTYGFGLAFTIILFFSLIFVISYFKEFLTAAFNPEYWALREILEKLR